MVKKKNLLGFDLVRKNVLKGFVGKIITIFFLYTIHSSQEPKTVNLNRTWGFVSLFLCLCQLCPNLERLKWFRWVKVGKPTILWSFFIVGLHSQLAPDVERWILSQHKSHCHNCPKNNLPHAFQVLNVQKICIWQIVQRFLWHVEDDKHLEHKAKNMLPPHPFMAYGSDFSSL